MKPLGRSKATRIATAIGRWMAIAFGLVGLFTFNVFLILIAAFIYTGASAERARFDARDVLPTTDVERMG